MRKIIALFFVTLVTVSCRQEVNPTTNRVSDPTGGLSGSTSDKKKDSFYDFKQNGYSGQLPYIVSNDAGEVSEFNTQYELAEKVRDSTVTWEYFDSLYSEELTTGQKQNIGVFVLRTKNLIGLARDDPRNATYQTAIRKYVDVLVSTKYFGYSLLYAALEQCQDTGYKKRKAIEVVNYSIGESFHQTFLNNPELPDDWRQQKVEEDLTYLSKLRSLIE